MFKFGPRLHDDQPYGQADRGQFQLFDNGSPIATYVYWAFSGCGSAILTNLGNCWGEAAAKQHFWNDKKKLNALVKWLKNNQPTEGHNAEEFYILLSEGQDESGGFEAFKKHPNVKLVDKYKKKPYGGTPLYLYRLSLQKDFDGLD